MINKDSELKKHSSAIQISNKVSLLQRKCWNVLLANAYDDLPNTDIYDISVSDFTNILWFDSKNIDYLKESLSKLASTKVEWDILWKDKEPDWWEMPLLVEPAIKWSRISYSFWPKLRKKLHNPNMYAKLQLSMQNKFDSKYTLALYELCIDYFDEKRKKWETPFMEVSTFRSLLWLWENEYSEFKVLNRDIIKKATKEINKKTDLFIEFAFKKFWRSISDIKIYIELEQKNEVEWKKEFINQTISNDIHIDYFVLLQKTFLLTPKQSEEVIEKYTDVNVLYKILNEIEIRYKKKEVKNLWAYTYKVLMDHSWIIKSDIDIELKQEEYNEKQNKKEVKNDLEEGRKNFNNWFNSLSVEKQNELIEKYKKWSTYQDKELLIKSRISTDYKKGILK